MMEKGGFFPDSANRHALEEKRKAGRDPSVSNYVKGNDS